MSIVASVSLPKEHLQPDRPLGRRVVVGVAAVLWCGVFVLGVFWAFLILALDSMYCERRDSESGELGWSLLPPGPTCTYPSGTGGVSVWEPTPVMSVWLLME